MCEMWTDDAMARHLGFESADNKETKIRVSCHIYNHGNWDKDRHGKDVLYQIPTIKVTVKRHNEAVNVKRPYCTMSGMPRLTDAEMAA